MVNHQKKCLIAKDSNFDMLTLLTHNRDCYYGILIIHGLLLWLLLLYIYYAYINGIIIP